MTTPERPKLYVEGKDDFHVIIHLLQQHGIQTSIKDPKEGGRDQVLDAIRTAVPVSNGRSVGFVLDADNDPRTGWSAVRDRLREVGMDPPETMPDDGYVDDLEKYKARVGVWLMPNNEREGALEEFLVNLVPQGDPLFKLAKCSTKKARSKGAQFPEVDHLKAVLCAWLAWQEEPGLPYGTAIKAKFFRHDSAAALAFVAWYKRLFPGQG